MRQLPCAALLSILFAVVVQAQELPSDPQANILVSCGAEKVAIFADSETDDGAFALGWTIRPNGKKAPVDWSSYDRNEPAAILDKFPLDDELDPAKGDYALVDGVVDLKAGKFTPLVSKFPYFPHKNHGNLSVAWSEAREGKRYAIVGNDARFFTFNFWLVQIKPEGSRVIDLSPAAEKAASRFMRRRDPKDYQHYGFTYAVGDPDKGGGAEAVSFMKDKVTVRFEAGVPKSEVDIDAGKITFSLPQGTVLRVTPDK